MTYQGLPSDLFAFFEELSANQSRDWFQTQKRRHEVSVRLPMQELITATNEELAAKGIPLAGDPKRSLSRINRDVRFSKDKSPYKTYVSATFTREPGEMSAGLIYLQLSPTESFVGLGFFAIEKLELDRMRQAIVARSGNWQKIEEDLHTAGHPVGGEDSLKRMPRGFETFADSRIAGALRQRNFTCKMMLTPHAAQSPDLPKRISIFTDRSRALLDFGWSALAD